MPERADAARNRAKILAAAEELFTARGAADVTMEDIARTAGVGRGTLYRRYPDRAAIAVALLDEHERRLQESLLRGDPPLGPGAPPAERLAAFYAAMVDLLDRHAHLVLGTEVGHSRFKTGAYGFWHTHVRVLAARRTPPTPMSWPTSCWPRWRRSCSCTRPARGVSPERITASLRELAARSL